MSNSELLAATGDGVFISTDNDQTCKQEITGMVSNAAADTFIASVAFVPNGSGGTDLLAGIIASSSYSTYGGIFVSSNHGVTWSAADSGIVPYFPSTPNFYYTTASLLTVGSNVFAGLAGGGGYVSMNQGASWTPFDSGMTGSCININDLTVHNDTLFDGQINARTYHAVIDGSRLASGVYYYRLQAGAYADTKN